MTNSDLSFSESCRQLTAALQQIGRVLIPVMPVLLRLTLQVLVSAIPGPIRRVWNAINERWLNALLIAVVGGLIALWLAVLVATYAGWI